MEMIELSTLEYLSESELKKEVSHIEKMITNLIKLQSVAEEKLARMIINRREFEKKLREEAKLIIFQRNLANAERIERKISRWFEIHWREFQFLYINPIKGYDFSKIHTSYQGAEAVLPRQIMIYFINKYSGFNITQIAEYYEFCKGAQATGFCIRKIEEYINTYISFRDKVEQIDKMLNMSNQKK